MKLILGILTLAATALFAQDDPLSLRVRQEALDQLHPIQVNAGMRGITTLQFPARIQAIDGDGFTQKPNEEAGDFLISSGDNWVSVKALKADARQNLNVIIGGKAYAVMVQAAPDNDFTVLFRFGNKPGLASAGKPTPRKPVSDSRLMGLMSKLELYPVSVNTPAAAMYADMEIGEPKGGKGVDETEQVKSRIVRVLHDRGLDSLGFEVQLTNKTDADFTYDPSALTVRAGQAEFKAITGEGAGKIPPKGSDTAFFIVSGSGNTSIPADLSVNNDFHLIIK
jgi:hypothetical protein